MTFHFSGTIPSSKSLLLRFFILKTFCPDLQFKGSSECEDVLFMKKAVEDLMTQSEKPLDCGSSASAFRFLAFRVSRIPGKHILLGTKQLFKRPHESLKTVLTQLGCSIVFTEKKCFIESKGWNPFGDVFFDVSQSSQFLSGFLLSAWELPHDLKCHIFSDYVSEDYLKITKKLVSSLGLMYEEKEDTITIFKGQKIIPIHLVDEPDMSSAFSVAALGAVGGKVSLIDFPKKSLQPDFIFIDLLKRMGVSVRYENQQLTIEKSSSLKPIIVNLKNNPDLFPVLSILCTLAPGESFLYGAPHLVNKESNRIDGTVKLLNGLGVKVIPATGGLRIFGQPLSSYHFSSRPRFEFDPLGDHRLAMAGLVAQMAGFSIRVLNPECVKKSFPEFLDIYHNNGGGKKNDN